MAHIKPKDNVTVPMWKLKMGNWGTSEGDGHVWCEREVNKKDSQKDSDWRMVTLGQAKREHRRSTFIEARIKDEGVEIETKPFWMRKTKALEKVNEALTEFINNFNDNTVVEKGKLPVVVYTEEYINGLLGNDPDFKRITYNA